jgi:outer membrane protein assembly factor BamD
LYEKKGSFPAAANRFQALVDQYPLFSKADEALWQLADSYHRMGDRFENQQASAYTRIVKDYPLSVHAEDARAQLEVMKRTVPEADPVATARMKFEMENRKNPSMTSHFWGLFRSRPDVSQAAKSGTPPIEGYRPTIPTSVPASAATPGGLGTNEVSISNPGSDSEIDKGKEVRANVPGAETPAAGTPASPAAGAPAAGAPATAAPATATPAAPATPPAANAAAPPDPNQIAKQSNMTPAQQKKEYQKQLKQQQDAVKKAQSDRRKKEAELQQRVKEQKKKSKAEQDQQKQEDKKPQTPAPTGGQAPPPPDKQ